MKLKLFILLHFLTVLLCKADGTRNYVSAGFGAPNLPRFFFNYLDNKNQFNSTGTGPLHLKYENRITSWFGFGLSVNHITYTVSYSDDFLDTSLGKIVPNKIKISSNNTAFNLRSNFHLINPEKNPKLDIYLGFGIGYRTGKLSIDSEYKEGTPSITLPKLSHLGFETTAGMRYFFDDNLGLYTEIGIAKSIVQFGFVGKF